MLRRGIERIAGRQTDIMIPLPFNPVDRARAGRPGSWRIASRPIRCRMARSWGIGSDRSFGCAHCGARYAVRAVASGGNDGESVYCEVCRRKMGQL